MSIVAKKKKETSDEKKKTPVKLSHTKNTPNQRHYPIFIQYA